MTSPAALEESPHGKDLGRPPSEKTYCPQNNDPFCPSFLKGLVGRIQAQRGSVLLPIHCCEGCRPRGRVKAICWIPEARQLKQAEPQKATFKMRQERTEQTPIQQWPLDQAQAPTKAFPVWLNLPVASWVCCLFCFLPSVRPLSGS